MRDWDRHFLKKAKLTAEMSTCLRVPGGVGAVYVRPERRVELVSGFAGSARGEVHCSDPDVGCMIDDRTGGCVRTIHAEINGIITAAENGVSLGGSTVYTTLSPCWACWLALVNVGVQRVVFAREYRDFSRQRAMAARRSIGLVHLPLDPDDFAPTTAAPVAAPPASS